MLTVLTPAVNTVGVLIDGLAGAAVEARRWLIRRSNLHREKIRLPMPCDQPSSLYGATFWGRCMQGALVMRKHDMLWGNAAASRISMLHQALEHMYGAA
jgi:hypothetical protein